MLAPIDKGPSIARRTNVELETRDTIREECYVARSE
jgi:hypothetical protein